MIFVQYIKQIHDAFQGYTAKNVNVELTAYLQFFETLSQKLWAITTQYTQLSKNNKWVISYNFNIYSKISSRRATAYIYSLGVSKAAEQ
jgi:hypothetical protein